MGNQIAPTESVAGNVTKPSGTSTTKSFDPIVSPMSDGAPLRENADEVEEQLLPGGFGGGGRRVRHVLAPVI